MLQAGEHPDLTDESELAHFGAWICVQDFERDLSVVSGVSREIDGREGSLPDFPLDLVSAGEGSPQGADGVAGRLRNVGAFL
jgi:hypothetical protein